MAAEASQVGTELCYASAIHLLFIHLCAVQSYFNNGLRFVRENASQPRGTNLIVPGELDTSPSKHQCQSHTELAVDRFKRKQERTVTRITWHVRHRNKWTRTLNPVQVLGRQKAVLYIHCDILAGINGHIVPDYNDS